MIPKTIHYCWFGGTTLPANVKKCIKSWDKFCPDYDIKRWDESNFDVTAHPFMKAAYEAQEWAFVSDYARLKIVYDNGGIYLDTDVELLKKLDVLRKYSCYFGIQQEGHLCATGLGFGASQGHPIIKQMLEQYDELDFCKQNKKSIACPYLNNRVLEKMGYIYSQNIVELDGVLILPSYYLDPFAPGSNTENLLCEETFSIHHYNASWMGKGIALKRKILQIIGPQVVNKIKGIFKYE